MESLQQPSGDIVPFAFEGQRVRTIQRGEDVWFLASDVCEILELNNVAQVTSRLDNDEKNTIILNDGTPGNPTSTIISESGFYSLVLSSRKPIAKPFKRWVTHEVLPALRRVGRYEIESPHASPLAALKQIVGALESQEKRLTEMESWKRDSPISIDAPKLANVRVMIQNYGLALGGDRRAYGKAYNRFYDHFDVMKYDHLPIHRYSEAMGVLTQWIKQANREKGVLLE